MRRRLVRKGSAPAKTKPVQRIVNIRTSELPDPFLGTRVGAGDRHTIKTSRHRRIKYPIILFTSPHGPSCQTTDFGNI